MRGSLSTGLLALGLLALAGCAPGDVEFNGKIFETMGLGQTKTGSVPKVPERAPLIVPPSLQRLPQPGEVPPQAADANFPVDPERSSDQKQQQLAAAQTAYCKENYDKQIALGNRTHAETAIGPLGRCQASAFTNLTGGSPLSNLEKK